MPILEVENISFSYDSRPVLQQVSLTLEKGETTALIGASGSGKTTLFKLICGLLAPLSGQVRVAGLSLPQGQQAIAYMTQSDLLLPWRSVLDNLRLPFELAGAPVSVTEPLNLLEEMALSHCHALFPQQLSGGMRQRISLARTLLQQRPLLLLDEPFGSLDVHTREQMYGFLRQKQQTILMVTHDFRDALCLADRLLLLSNGRIAQEWRLDPTLRSDPQAQQQLQEEIRAGLA